MITRLNCPSSANNMSANKQMINFDLKFKQKYALMMQRQIKQKQKQQKRLCNVKSQRYLMEHLFENKDDKKQQNKQPINSLCKSKLVQNSICKSKSKQALNNYLRWSRQKRSVLSLDIDQYRTHKHKQNNRYNKDHTIRHSNRYNNGQSFRYRTTDQDINQLNSLHNQISNMSNKGTPKSINKQFSDRKLNDNQTELKMYNKSRSQSSKYRIINDDKRDINLHISTQKLNNKYKKPMTGKNKYNQNNSSNTDNYLLECNINTNNNNEINVKNKYYSNQLKYQRAIQQRSRDQLKINNSISTILADARREKIDCQLLNQLRYRQRAKSCNEDGQSYRSNRKGSRLSDKYSLLSGKNKEQLTIKNYNCQLIKKIKTKFNNSKNKFDTQFGNLLDLIHRKSQKKPQLSRNQLLISRKDQRNQKYNEKYQDHGSNVVKRYYQKQSKRYGSVEELSGIEYCLLSTRKRFGDKKNGMQSKIIKEQKQINKIKQSLVCKKQKLVTQRQKSNQKSTGSLDYDQYILILDKSRCNYNKRKQIVLNFGHIKKQDKAREHKQNLFDTKHSYSPWSNKDRGNTQQVQEIDSQNQGA